MWAELAISKCFHIVELAISLGADVNHIGTGGRTPIFDVGQSKRMFDRLVARGARTDVRDNNGQLPAKPM